MLAFTLNIPDNLSFFLLGVFVGVVLMLCLAWLLRPDESA